MWGNTAPGLGKGLCGKDEVGGFKQVHPGLPSLALLTPSGRGTALQFNLVDFSCLAHTESLH